ncbi:hypothetical protein TNCV_2919041 [Trichonephila clavipes]|nr:hypothetical protein TNCV_2919041 [Trichonephila clavipes]
MSHLAFFAHVFHHGGQQSNCQHSGGRSRRYLPHGGSLEPPYDPQPGQQLRRIRWVPRHATFPTCLSASGASFVTWLKEVSSRDRTSGECLKSWDLEMLPHFRDDRTLPDHLHDEVHEDVSECTMVYRFE